MVKDEDEDFQKKQKKEAKRQKVANSTQEERKVAKVVRTAKDLELVLNSQGKRIGKKDAKGAFLPYKKRGRPPKNATTAGSQ